MHALRQPLSALLLLVDRAQHAELPDDAALVIAEIGQQVDELVAVARGISRLVGVISALRAASRPVTRR